MEIRRINNSFLPSFFRNFEDDFFNGTSAKNLSQVAVNIIENKDNHVIELAVPGFQREDIAIEVEGNKLIIEGEVSGEKEVKEDNYTHKEFSYGEFIRSFTLPKEVDVKHIDAVYKNGVLQVIVKKPELVAKEVKRIEVKGS